MVLVERLDRALVSSASLALLLAGVGLALWAGTLLVAQCLFWLKFGQWQPIPTFALALAGDQQVFQLVPVALLFAEWNPLALVPSLGIASGPDEAASALGGNLAGLVKVIAWSLHLPLTAVLVGGALTAFWAFAWAQDKKED